MKHVDYLVVGGGPAGVFFAYEMALQNPGKSVMVIERGKRIEERYCPESAYGKCVKCKPYCHVTNGVAGSGGRSDGKLTLCNPQDTTFYVGGNLHDYLGVEETKNLISYTDSIYLKFGATAEIKGIKHEKEIDRVRKKFENVGLKLINAPIRHLGSDKAQILYERMEHYIEKLGVELLVESEVVDLLVNENHIEGVTYKDQYGKMHEVHSSNVIIAVGRVGAKWLLEVCGKYHIKTLPGIIDVGVRYELPDSVMKELNTLMYEAKVIGRPMPYLDKVRTFCQNPSGFVSAEVYDDPSGLITLVNGHSCIDSKSENTNLALLVSLELMGVENPMEYSRMIARHVNYIANGNPIVQRLGDLKSGKRTWASELANNSVVPTLKTAEPGDLGLGMPARVIKNIVSFIDMMDKVAPGFAHNNNLLYGPELKFYSNKVVLSQKFETSIAGLYAIGDGCGLTRGLMMASASGVALAHML